MFGFVLLSVASHAFVIGSYDYRIEGVISDGGPTEDGAPLTGQNSEAYVSVGQPIISYNWVEKIGYIDYLNENSKENYITYQVYKNFHPKLAFYILKMFKKIKFI